MMIQQNEKPARVGNSKAGVSQPSNIKSLPHFKEYENNILGCTLRGEMLADQWNGLLPNDFYYTRNQIIAQAILQMRDKKIPIDVLTFTQFLKEQNLYEDIGGFSYIGYLVETAISPANSPCHIEEVIKASQLRQLWELHHRGIQAIERGANREKITELGNEIERLSRPKESNGNIISLADYKPQNMTWFLEYAIPDKFPTTIYGDGGLGKSYLGLYFATLATLGKQNFLGLRFPEEPLNVLYLDWELDIDEFSRRTLKIANGLGLSKIPSDLHYYSPDKSLYKLLPELKGIVISKRIQFLIFDSLGAACVDPEDVWDIVEVFSQIKNLGIATLILDHQSKMQSQDNYNTKTPYGSVYKYNLSRSVFQLSSLGIEGNIRSLMLKHKKSNFGSLLDDLLFDVAFEGDRVLFYKSKALSPEEKDMRLIHETMVELENKAEKVNQKNLIVQLKGILGRDRVVTLLEKGEGKYWEKQVGHKKENLYKSKTLKNGDIYNQGFRVLENEGSEDEINIPEVIA